MARGYARGMEKRAGEARGWGLFGLTGLVGDALRALLLPDDPLAWGAERMIEHPAQLQRADAWPPARG